MHIKLLAQRLAHSKHAINVNHYYYHHCYFSVHLIRTTVFEISPTVLYSSLIVLRTQILHLSLSSHPFPSITMPNPWHLAQTSDLPWPNGRLAKWLKQSLENHRKPKRWEPGESPRGSGGPSQWISTVGVYCEPRMSNRQYVQKPSCNMHRTNKSY